MKSCVECKKHGKRITAVRVAGNEPDCMDNVMFCETKRHLYTNRDIYNHMEDICEIMKTPFFDTLAKVSKQISEDFSKIAKPFFTARQEGSD